MTEISCVHINLSRGDSSLIFIKYNKYYLIYNYAYKKTIILSYKSLMTIPLLYEIYIISLLLTENTQEIKKINNKYTISTRKFHKRIKINSYYDIVEVSYKNPLNKQEPKRESSCKKIKKF
jgi:hypothetical protein